MKVSSPKNFSNANGIWISPKKHPNVCTWNDISFSVSSKVKILGFLVKNCKKNEPGTTRVCADQKHMTGYLVTFWYPVLEKKQPWDFGFGFWNFGFWDYCVPVRNKLHFWAFGCLFLDGRRPRTPILYCTNFVTFRRFERFFKKAMLKTSTKGFKCMGIELWRSKFFNYKRNKVLKSSLCRTLTLQAVLRE